MSIQRINLIGVPVDICRPEEMENEILELLAKPGTKQIIFLSIWDLLKARRRGDFAECLVHDGTSRLRRKFLALR